MLKEAYKALIILGDNLKKESRRKDTGNAEIPNEIKNDLTYQAFCRFFGEYTIEL